MTGRGRPRIGTRVELVIPDRDLGDLDAIADERHISRAQLIRRILDEWLEAGEEPEEDDWRPVGW